MIERTQKNIIHNIIVIHQYQKDLFTHDYLPGMIQTLQDEGYPNNSTSIKIISWKYIKNIIIIEPKVLDFIQKFQNEVNSVQTNLQTEDLIKYEETILTSKKRIPGIVGGHHKKIKLFKKYFIKQMGGNHGINEIYNYYLIHKFFPKIIPFLAKCYGVIFISKELQINENRITKIIQSDKITSKDLIFYPMDRYLFIIL